MGKELIVIVDEWYERTWDVRKTGNRRYLANLEESSWIWRNPRLWRVKSSDVHWVNSKESKYTGTLRDVRKRKLKHKWNSARLSVRLPDKAREEKLHLHKLKVLRRVLAKVKSYGLQGSATYTEELASTSDNTLFIDGVLEDQSPFQSAVWFEQSGTDWKPQATCIVDVHDISDHPALYPLGPQQKLRTLDSGMASLRFDSVPMYVESAIAMEGTETTPPILIGNHYYQAFQFGPNLQGAVRNQMPLALICERADGCRWRSTPFDLEFAQVRLSGCELLLTTYTDEEDTHSTCCLVGSGPDGRFYYTDLGRDDWVLRWNLHLQDGFEPSEVNDADSDANAALAGEEDDFFLECEYDYPPLGQLSCLDGWLGGDAWRSGERTAPLYNALNDARLLHLQFGIALTDLGMTDAIVTFRGTPLLTEANGQFSFGRSLFRIAVGQPFSEGAGNVLHESHLHATVHEIPCEGYKEPGEDSFIINLRPLEDAQIPALIRRLQINLPYDPAPAVTQFSLRLELDTGRWALHAGNDQNFDLIVQNPSINPIPAEQS